MLHCAAVHAKEQHARTGMSRACSAARAYFLHGCAPLHRFCVPDAGAASAQCKHAPTALLADAAEGPFGEAKFPARSLDGGGADAQRLRRLLQREMIERRQRLL
eukprot:728482-Rhodomonas_salina.1